LADSNGVRCNRGQLSDKVSKRPMEIEAQQRPQQPVVRSKIKGCSGDIRKDVADSNDRRRKVQVEGRQSSKQVPRSESKERRTCNGQWEIEPRLGRVVDGCADRVDRIRLLGNGVVPQTAAKAWTTLNKRLEARAANG